MEKELQGRTVSWKIATGSRNPVKETEKATMKRDKTGVYCLVMVTEEGHSEQGVVRAAAESRIRNKKKKVIDLMRE